MKSTGEYLRLSGSFRTIFLESALFVSFEMHPAWVPNLDGAVGSVHILLLVIPTGN